MNARRVLAGGAVAAALSSLVGCLDTAYAASVATNFPRTIQVYPVPSSSPFPVSGALGTNDTPSVVTGSVSVSNFPTPMPYPTAPPVQPVSGTVSVANFPTPVPRDPVRAVSVQNWPAYPTPMPVQPVSGSVSISGPITIANPATPPPVQPVSGTVTISNPYAAPAIQPISGSVTITNPVTPPPMQAVSGTVTIANPATPPPVQPVSGNVSVSNFPTPVPVQTIAGTVSLTALPTPQPVTYSIVSAAGTKTVLNRPGAFFGVSNLHTVAQTVAVTCYDNAAAASGPVVFSAIVGLAPLIYPAPGVGLTSGLTCSAPLSLLGGGEAIYVR